MVIYGDILFAVNGIIDYLLLLVTARLAGSPLRRGRFLLGAALGGGYAVAVFLPGFSFLDGAVYKGLFALLMLLIAFWGSGGMAKHAALFFMLACALGGGVAAVGFLDGSSLTLGRGVVYSVPDLKVVLLSAAGCYLLLSRLAPRLAMHGGRELHTAVLELMDRRLELTALLDTGNTLSDPASGRRVPVAEGMALRPLFPEGSAPTREQLLRPVEGLEGLNRGACRGRFRLLPYRAVGVERGFLLAVRLDAMTVDGRREEGQLLALSPTPVSDGGGYRILIGGW